MRTKWETLWDCRDSQEVGLEAAILERVRNSSLVEGFCAENVTGLKYATEAAGLREGVVGERCVDEEAVPEGAVESTEVRMLV